MIAITKTRRLRRTGVALASVALLAIPIASSGGAGSVNAASRIPSYDRSIFNDDSTVIDNGFFPIRPGTQYVLQGTADRGAGGPTPHQVVFTVTDLVKVIDGVRTVAVWDVDTNDGEVQEAELAFFAQDRFGNVWNLGEYPEEYDGGVFTGAPRTWITLQSGAVGGIHVQDRPVVGDSYVSGYAPAIGFHDFATVNAKGQHVCATIGCFNNVLVIDETNNTAGDGHQFKNYAPGVGIIRVDPVGGTELESLLLSSTTQLSAASLADARRQALRLDRRAYTFGGADYRATPRARPEPW